MKKQLGTIVILCALLARGITSEAQDVTLTLVDEQDIGMDCPVTSAVQPGTDVMWLLMDNCGGSRFSLRAYDVNQGEWVNNAPIPLNEIVSARYAVYPFAEPMAFTPDGVLQIMAADGDFFVRFQVDVESGAVTSDAAEEINALLRQFSEFPAFATTFSKDHLLAAVSDDEGIMYHILDLASGGVLFKVETPGSFVMFGGDWLYVSAPHEPENYDNFDATLFIYSLPDGAVIQTLELPISVVYPSADGRAIAIEIISNESGKEQLAVVDVETGRMSATLPISVPPRKAMTCHNTGRDVSDVDFTASGRLSIRGLAWLPDNAGFITINAYDGMQTNTGCIFEYSRARRYGVGG